MYLMLSKTVFWQLSLHAFKIFFPSAQTWWEKLNPQRLFCFGVHIWGICVACVPFGVEGLQPWSSSGLVCRILPFGGRLGNYHDGVGRADDQAWSQRSASSPGVGREAQGVLLLQKQWPFCVVQHCHKVQKWKRSWGMEVWSWIKIGLASICSWERLPR